jgi:hypothetical protein
MYVGRLLIGLAWRWYISIQPENQVVVWLEEALDHAIPV